MSQPDLTICRSLRHGPDALPEGDACMQASSIIDMVQRAETRAVERQHTQVVCFFYETGNFNVGSRG